MTNRILGYIISALGILGLLLSVDAIKTALKITLPAFATNTIITIVSIIILGAGLFLIFNTAKEHMEVPIYHGKQVVGYRKVPKVN